MAPLWGWVRAPVYLAKEAARRTDWLRLRMSMTSQADPRGDPGDMERNPRRNTTGDNHPGIRARILPSAEDQRRLGYDGAAHRRSLSMSKIGPLSGCRRAEFPVCVAIRYSARSTVGVPGSIFGQANLALVMLHWLVQ